MNNMYYSALLGKPVDHSISPDLFWMIAKLCNIEYAHIKIETINQGELGKYLNYLQQLGFAGVNITLPYKISVIPYLSKLDKSAQMVGAVNTIVFDDNNLIGYNTDAQGAILAIESELHALTNDDHVLIFGAGGAARAVIYEIYKKTHNITILNRNMDKAKKIATELSRPGKMIQTQELTSENIEKYISQSNFIINATSVGMSPDVDTSLVSKNSWEKIGSVENKYFFDVIFNPYKTRLLIDAQAHGAIVCSGLYMMIFQAIAAFQLWTGKKISASNVPLLTNKLQEILELHD